MKDEIIIGEVLNQPQRHAEKWATQIDHDGFESWLYLDEMLRPGGVKITVSQFIEYSELARDKE